MRVFISHSAKDTAAASRIRAALSGKGFKVWDPERQILPGSNWLTETGRALAHSDAVVFLLSGDADHEPFARREVQYVISHPKYEDRVFPVRLGRDSGKIPWILNHMSVIDAEDNDVDRAADEIASRLKSVKTRKPGMTTLSKGVKKRLSRRE